MLILRIVIIFLIVIVLAGVVFFLLSSKKEKRILFRGAGLDILAEVANNPISWSKGLMFRENLDINKGMLFIFPDSAKRTFWMKNTKIALDLIFMSKDKIITEIKENFKPCMEGSCTKFTTIRKAKYVLEINAGLVEKYNIEVGQKVEF